MARLLPIERCDDCVNFKHVKGPDENVRLCLHSSFDDAATGSSGKVLDYHGLRAASAVSAQTIPTWCPLVKG